MHQAHFISEVSTFILMDMLKCPWGPAKNMGFLSHAVPMENSTSCSVHKTAIPPGQDAFPPARLCSCGTEELLLVSLGVSATWLRCKVSRMGMDVLTTHWYFMGAMPAISSPISHSGHSAKPQSVTCPRCSQRPPWLWSRWTRATARFGPWDNDNMDITLRPINIPSTISIFWISGYCIKIPHVTNWLFPSIQGRRSLGNHTSIDFLSPRYASTNCRRPSQMGSRQRWILDRKKQDHHFWFFKELCCRQGSFWSKTQMWCQSNRASSMSVPSSSASLVPRYAVWTLFSFSTCSSSSLASFSHHRG